jgi:hypothetical protein
MALQTFVAVIEAGKATAEQILIYRSIVLLYGTRYL